jgi:8-oxo-dGTP pyrophosphatase MutT (NUDIX family)
MTSVRPVVRRSARALLVDDEQRLVLIERTKPGRPVYVTTPGGGVKDGESTTAALERELGEELGATVTIGGRVLLVLSEVEGGVEVQEVFVAQLRAMRKQDRTGAEWSDPARGGYAVVRVPLDEVGAINLKPDELREFASANIDALLAEAADLV